MAGGGSTTTAQERRPGLGLYGNYGCLVRGYAYLRELGPEASKRATELAGPTRTTSGRSSRSTTHWRRNRRRCTKSSSVMRAQGLGVETLDVAKRIMDFGYHPPTMYFP